MNHLSRQFARSRVVLPLGLATLLVVCVGSVSGHAQAMAYAASTSSAPAVQEEPTPNWQTPLVFRAPNLTLGNVVAYNSANLGPQPAALTTTDQQNTTGGSQAGASSPQGVGQSFTPTQATMNAVTLPLFVTSGFSSATVQLQVFAGGGFGGTLLATGTPVTFTNATFQTVELTLATPLTLTPGSQYTFRANVTAGSYFYSSSTTDVYAGGNRYSSTTGAAQAASDLVFAEGFDSSVGAVPEPSTWALLGVGVGVLGVVILRRRSAARA